MTGMCPALLHGLDYAGQTCDFCEAMNKRAARHQRAMTTYLAPFKDRAYCVACPECSSDPLIGCVADSGRSCKPHGKREARANGLKSTPRRGHYQRPKNGIQFNEAERQAFQLLGHAIPK